MTTFDNTPRHILSSQHPEPPAGGFWLGGLGLALRHWRCFTWTAFISFVLALIASIPSLVSYGSLLNTSAMASTVYGPLHGATLAEMGMKISEIPSGGRQVSFVLDILFAVIVFITAPGVLAIYLSGEPASLGNMLRSGLRYFWRFVRLVLVWGIVMLVVVGIVAFLRKGVMVPMDRAAATKGELYFSIASGIVIWAVIALFRLWVDLAEVVTVDRGLYRLGAQEDRRSVRTLGAGWTLLRAGFVRLYLGFVTTGALGWAGLILFVLIWHAISPYAVFRGFLLGQLGLMCLLFARFWQRGMETAWFLRNTALVTPIAIPLVAPAVYVEPVGVVTHAPVAAPYPTPVPVVPGVIEPGVIEPGVIEPDTTEPGYVEPVETPRRWPGDLPDADPEPLPA